MYLQPSWHDVIPATVTADQASSHPASTKLEELQHSLKPGWTVHVAQDRRLYYCNHLTRTSSWLPPAETWSESGGGFPYGWEEAIDSDGKSYFINHLNKTTTYEDPRKDWTEEPPQPREVELSRHPELGFGFVAGSEKPVIVRFVTEGGPSEDKLQPGDQILNINGEDVKKAPRDHVIQLVRSCKETVKLTVCQPPLDNSTRKSALLSAAKKAKLKTNPSRVRFAEGVVVNGSPLFPPSTFSLDDSSVPFLPNVLKVFLENGQTKSFKYDSNTLVQDVVESLQQKLCIRAVEHFSLVVEHIKSLRRNKLTLLDPQEPLARIAARPGSHNLRCLFRVAFVPKDACDLAQRDLVAFEYLFMQCCNDVVQERYAPELKYDIALRLAALHIHQHAISNNMTGKVTVKAIEREFGLERFVPVSLMSSMKRKELRKLIGHFLKLNHNLSPTGQKSLTSLQAKLYYLNIISELPSYGAKCFSTNIRDNNIERVILISPKFGISQIAGQRNSVPVHLADIEQMSLVTVTQEDELSRCVCIHIPTSDEKELTLSMEDRDAEELVLVLQGYYRLLTGQQLPVDQDRDLSWANDSAPPYHSQHQVLPARWSYTGTDSSIHYATFSMPPSYQPIHQVKSNGHLSPSCNKPIQMDEHGRSTFGVDNNMNSMSALVAKNGSTGGRDCNGYSFEDNRRAVAQKLLDLSAATFDLQSVVSMEILESDLVYVEARNEEVLRRVAEMQELVQNSEQYLTQQAQQHYQLQNNHHLQQQHHQQQDSAQQHHSKEESDSEGSHISSADSDAPGQLKHSDSLLLLTQGQKLISDAVKDAVRSIDLGDNEPSESDTDSLCTPTSSPSHKPATGKNNNGSCGNSVKSSGSSFGLHSPDSLLPVGCHPSDSNIQDILKKLQEDSSLPYNFAEGTLYLDPDIIDLTMIPPPITPDEDGTYALPPQLSLPPTPFADQFPLETELRNSREQLINEKNTAASFTLDLDDQDSLLDELLGLEINKTPTVEESQPMGLDLSLDIEAFLATVTVPPPTLKVPPSVELTPEEISSFIIPPPPTGSTDSLNGDLNTPVNEENSFEQHCKKFESPTKVIEYPTVNRKGGAFSCCGKYDSPEKDSSDLIQPPPRNGSENLKPPVRPPKSCEHFIASVHQRNNSFSNNSINAQPPLLPPRSDSVHAHQRLPPKKPPLPPVPSQEVLRRNNKKETTQGHNPIASGGNLLKNGHIFSENSSSLEHGRKLLCSKSDITMVGLLERLDLVIAQCSQAQAAGGGTQMDEHCFQMAKEELTNEARQLVTASKLLVKSATDAATRHELPSNLANCLDLLHKLTELSANMTAHTTAPLQTRNLVLKVRDVASVFREMLVCTLDLEVQEAILLQRAEGLASVLATLLRSLRVFSP